MRSTDRQARRQERAEAKFNKSATRALKGVEKRASKGQTTQDERRRAVTGILQYTESRKAR